MKNKLLIQLITWIFMVLSIQGLFAQQTVEFKPNTAYEDEFNLAYQKHPSIPRGVLEAVAFTNTKIRHLRPEGTTSCSGMPAYFGVMGLIPEGKNYFRENLKLISQLSGYSESEIIASPEICILAYAKAFEIIMQKSGVVYTKVEDYMDVVLSLSELPLEGESNAYCLDTYLYSILTFLNTPEYRTEFNFPDYNIGIKDYFGAINYRVLSSKYIVSSPDGITPKGEVLRYIPSARKKNIFKGEVTSPMVSDYSRAIWDPTSCNFSSRNGRQITHITIHTMQGGYAGSISWFKNCDANASAHYCVRAFDGQVTQMVAEINSAWHVRNSNPYSIGIENEGFVDDPTWYTTAMYNANAGICLDVSRRRNINTTMAYNGPASGSVNSITDCYTIKGHQHFPNQSHHDPGINWDWKRFYELLNPTLPVTNYSTATGTFLDSGGNAGNYASKERKRYRIAPVNARTVTLTFTSFNLELNYDYMYVYDGADNKANLIGTYTGTTLPPAITGNSGKLYIEFSSDCATVAAGWVANWTSSNTPATCSPPVNLQSTANGHSSRILTWGAVPGALGYQVQMRRHMTNTWTTSTTTTNNLILTGLASNGHYIWQVRTICPGNTYSTWAGSDFITPITGNSTLPYCTGNFRDAGSTEGKYANSENYTTVIAPPGATSVKMVFSSFATYNSSDVLKIFNGPNISSPLIGSYHTNTSPGTVTATSGAMTLQWVSSVSNVSAGWAATWTCTQNNGCGIPSSLSTSIITANSGRANWSAVSGATFYEFRWKALSSPTWSPIVTVNALSYNIPNLAADTQYEWQVRAVCQQTRGNFTGSTVFKTLTNCGIPGNLSTSNITNTAARFSWLAVNGAVNYTIQWRQVGNPTWNSISTGGITYTLSGLTQGTNYEWQVRANCSNGSSDYSSAISFKTTAPQCDTPVNLSTFDVGYNSASISWNAIPLAVDYTIQYRKVGNPTWTIFNSSTNSYTITGLNYSTEYEWQVRANCGFGNSSFSIVANFTTEAPPCLIPTGAMTQSITYNSATLVWDAMPGAVNYRIIYRKSSDVTWTGLDVAGTSYTLTGLDPNTEYRWGVRTNCTNNNSDYTGAVIFTTDYPPCGLPTGLNTSSIAVSGAKAGWSAVVGAVDYTIQWRKIGNPTWLTASTSNLFYMIAGLDAYTQYEWQVKTNCVGNSSSFTSSTNFTTLPLPCNIPAGLNTTGITETTATANWGSVSGAIDYTVQWRPIGNPTWSSATTSNLSYVMTGLTGGTNYEWQVRTNCIGNNSLYSFSVSFMTEYPPCDMPGSLNTTGVSQTTATANWGSVSGAVNYTVQWRKIGNPTWSSTTTSNLSYVMTGLSPASNYEWQVKTNCIGNSSAFTSSTTFTTWIICNTPGSLITNGVSTTVATCSWGAVPGAIDYTFEYKRSIDPTYTVITVAGTTYNLTGLTASTAYNWRVKTNCGVGNYSLYSAVQNFTTTATCSDPNESNNSSPTATTIVANVSKLGRICGSGDVDWYKITIPSTINVRFTLSQLPANYNAELFINGTFVTGSYNLNQVNDVIIRNNQAPKTLYFRIYGQSGAYNDLLDYRVIAETSNIAFKEIEPTVSSDNLVSVYPNPARDLVNIRFNESTDQSHIQIYDARGVLVINKDVESVVENLAIDTSILPNGIYFLRVFSEGRVDTHKIIIEN